MAYVNLPPRGQLHEAEKRRLRREREQTSIDPVERYWLRELLGFVSRDRFGLYSKRPVSLEPPNQAAANVLREILNSVDCSSPNINQIIQNELLLRLGEGDKNIVLLWNKHK